LPDDAAIGPALPQLDQSVGDGISGTVVNRAMQTDSAVVRIADQLVIAAIGQGAVEKRPDGLPWGAS
jgi:hypothetical protein